MADLGINIELYRQRFSEQGLTLRAIAVLQFPVMMVFARMRVDQNQPLESLDRIILEYVRDAMTFNLDLLAASLGLSIGVLNYRISFLIENGLLATGKLRISLTDAGGLFLNTEGATLGDIESGLFLVHGIDFKPLPSSFYFNRENWAVGRRDRYDFALDVLPEPPTSAIVDGIMAIPVTDRENYHIPVGLAEIVEIECQPIGFPIGVAMNVDEQGKVLKRMIDCTSHLPNSEKDALVARLANYIAGTIPSLCIQLGTIKKTGIGQEVTQFFNNWKSLDQDRPDAVCLDSIFDRRNQETMEALLKQHYGFLIEDKRLVDYKATEISLWIDSSLLMQGGTNKSKIMRALDRGRDYVKQRIGTGVFVVFVTVSAGDSFVEEVLRISRKIFSERQEFSPEALFEEYEGNLDQLRKYLTALDEFELLLAMDIYRFMGKPLNGEWIHPNNPELAQ